MKKVVKRGKENVRKDRRVPITGKIHCSRKSYRVSCQNIQKIFYYLATPKHIETLIGKERLSSQEIRVRTRKSFQDQKERKKKFLAITLRQLYFFYLLLLLHKTKMKIIPFQFLYFCLDCFLEVTNLNQVRGKIEGRERERKVADIFLSTNTKLFLWQDRRTWNGGRQGEGKAMER